MPRQRLDCDDQELGEGDDREGLQMGTGFPLGILEPRQW